MRKIVISAIMLLVVLSGSLYAQEHTVTGKVTDALDGSGLPGVNVAVVGTSKGTISDMDGNYSITVPDNNAKLSFSFIGYTTQIVEVGSQTTINVVLAASDVGLEEVVVVGYGTMKKENLTGAVSTVDVVKNLESKPVADVGRSLQGVVSGVTITYASGNINADPNIKLRGFGSVNGSSDPLVLIDGVEGKLSDINPEAIANISVLKDAASTSIYGARAAFGVILVTTKKGKKGKTTVNYSNNFSWNTPIFDLKPAPMNYLMDAIHTAKDRNNGGAPFAFGMGGTDWKDKSIDWENKYGYLGSGMTNDIMQEGRDYEVIGGQFYSYRSWDVFDQILIDKAFAQTHNVSVSGGSDKIRYNISYGYTAKEGLYKENTETLDKHNFNGNLSADLSDWVTLNFRTMYTKRNYEEPFNYRAGSLGYLFYAMRWPSNFPYGVSDGKSFGAPAGSSFIGPIGFLREANRNCFERDYSRQTIETVFKILEKEKQQLNFTANFSYSHGSDSNHEKGGSVPMINWWSQGNTPVFDPLYYSTSSSRNQTTYRTSKEELYAMNAFANYSNTKLENHTFNLLGGMNMEKSQYLYIYTKRPFLLDPNLPELALATGDPSTNNSKEDWSVLGFFARLNYNYKNKLLLEFNGRMDGSSRFPAGDRFAFFPSMSAGYKISEEDFTKGIFEKIKVSNLKFRASWGQIGYQDVGKYAFVPTISSSDAIWIVNSQQEKTFNNPKAVSPSLTWETIETIDFGVDLGLFNNMVEVIFDIYQRKNKDMLGPGKQLPVVFGASIPKVNSGELTTKGWELTLNVKHRFSKDFDMYVTGVLSDGTAEITKWNNETGILSDFYPGMKLGEIWGFETDRLFQASDFNTDGSLQDGIPVQDPNIYSAGFNLGAGDVKYKDQNGDGVVDKGSFTKEDHGDLVVIGNTTPRYEYSFRIGANFKGFDFGVMFQGIGKRDYWGIGNVAIANFHYDNLFAHQTDYWREDNTDAFYPRPFASNLSTYIPNTRNIGRLLTSGGYMNMRGINNLVPQSRYLQDLSYFRLKDITLGYTLPSNIIQKLKIEKLRVYFAAYNVWEATGSFIPVDPESSINSHSSYSFYGTSLPQSRSFSFGFQITL
jgi:TonB-linked SusC/RagA family outer membrane protein